MGIERVLREWREGQDGTLSGGTIDLDRIQNLEAIASTDDLPPVENGRHQLEDFTGYWFNGFVTSNYGLELGTQTPILGSHGGLDGFIHTGGATAIYGRGAGVFMRDCYIHAPDGQIFDVAGDQTTEVLIQSTAFYDAAGLGNIANLGTFDGMRVPTFIAANFGDFDAGLTITGSPQKVSIIDTPFRNVTASGVTMLEFDANCSVNIVDITKGYVKDVQSDTEVVRVDPNATVSQIFQYTGNTHDASVTTSNILTGAAGIDAVGYRVKNSFPVADSIAIGNLTLDENNVTTTITTQAASKTDESAYERIEGATTSEVNRRFEPGDNDLTYIGKKDVVSELTGTVVANTGNQETVALAFFNDGSLVPGTATRVLLQGDQGFVSGIGSAVTSAGVCPNCATNSTYDLRVANLGSDTDIDIAEMNMNMNASL